MSAYYNEIDPYAAQWLRNLIAAGHIAPGEVDERSIVDVKPDDLRPFTQCHFFAGLGGWSAALRRAGWPDDRRVWTASCPCQPFSAAGAGHGMADKRHLWPDFYWLVAQLSPGEILGEQVASKDAEPWLDLVQADLERMAYAFGAVAFPSAGIGAPHIRDRTYWVAHASGKHPRPTRDRARARDARGQFKAGGLGDTHDPRPQGHTGHGGNQGRRGSAGPVASAGLLGRLADSDGRLQSGGVARGGLENAQAEWPQGAEATAGYRVDRGPGPVNGMWADADWLFCRDGRWRPVEAGTSPLAHGASARVGRLRAYGNAINVEAAAQFIAAYMEI